MRSAKPVKLNLFILLAASLLNSAMLYTASHAHGWWIILAAVVFSFSNNTMFSLLHECVHGSFADSGSLNCGIGRYAASWYPTGFSLQKAYHLQHHRYNRSASEQFDIIHPEDVRWLKYVQWYAIYTGVYWLVNVLGALVFALLPASVRAWLLQRFSAQGALQSGADSYIGVLDTVDVKRGRGEVMAAWVFQAALFYILDLNVLGWLICYVAFGWQWSSLQYTDHAFSPLDRDSGAWNLIVPKWVCAFFLNYHYHLAHHQHPEISWRYLPDYAEYGVSFWTIWRHCITGPKLINKLPKIVLTRLHK